MPQNDGMHLMECYSLRNLMCRTLKFASVACLAVLIVVSGCTTGVYKGLTLDPPAERVMVFDIEGVSRESVRRRDNTQEVTQVGVDGSVFARDLSSALTGLRIRVVPGSQFGKPVDMLTAAKCAREANAQAFIVGRITSSKSNTTAGRSKCEVHGSFELYDAANGEQIGGVADASRSEDSGVLGPLGVVLATPFEVVRTIVIPKSDSLYTQIQRDADKRADALSPVVLKRLAEHVARELGKGLGVVRR